MDKNTRVLDAWLLLKRAIPNTKEYFLFGSQENRYLKIEDWIENGKIVKTVTREDDVTFHIRNGKTYRCKKQKEGGCNLINYPLLKNLCRDRGYEIASLECMVLQIANTTESRI